MLSGKSSFSRARMRIFRCGMKFSDHSRSSERRTFGAMCDNTTRRSAIESHILKTFASRWSDVRSVGRSVGRSEPISSHLSPTLSTRFPPLYPASPSYPPHNLSQNSLSHTSWPETTFFSRSIKNPCGYVARRNLRNRSMAVLPEAGAAFEVRAWSESSRLRLLRSP